MLRYDVMITFRLWLDRTHGPNAPIVTKWLESQPSAFPLQRSLKQHENCLSHHASASRLATVFFVRLS